MNKIKIMSLLVMIIGVLFFGCSMEPDMAKTSLYQEGWNLVSQNGDVIVIKKSVETSSKIAVMTLSGKENDMQRLFNKGFSIYGTIDGEAILFQEKTCSIDSDKNNDKPIKVSSELVVTERPVTNMIATKWVGNYVRSSGMNVYYESSWVWWGSQASTTGSGNLELYLQMKEGGVWNNKAAKTYYGAEKSVGESHWWCTDIRAKVYAVSAVSYRIDLSFNPNSVY